MNNISLYDYQLKINDSNFYDEFKIIIDKYNIDDIYIILFYKYDINNIFPYFKYFINNNMFINNVLELIKIYFINEKKYDNNYIYYYKFLNILYNSNYIYELKMLNRYFIKHIFDINFVNVYFYKEIIKYIYIQNDFIYLLNKILNKKNVKLDINNDCIFFKIFISYINKKIYISMEKNIVTNVINEIIIKLLQKYVHSNIDVKVYIYNYYIFLNYNKNIYLKRLKNILYDKNCQTENKRKIIEILKKYGDENIIKFATKYFNKHMQYDNNIKSFTNSKETTHLFEDQINDKITILQKVYNESNIEEIKKTFNLFLKKYNINDKYIDIINNINKYTKYNLTLHQITLYIWSYVLKNIDYIDILSDHLYNVLSENNYEILKNCGVGYIIKIMYIFTYIDDKNLSIYMDDISYYNNYYLNEIKKYINQSQYKDELITLIGFKERKKYKKEINNIWKKIKEEKNNIPYFKECYNNLKHIF